MQKLLYSVFENIASHKGLEKKFLAQISAFKNYYKVKHFLRNCKDGFLSKLLNRVLTEIKYCIEVIFSDNEIIFYRYNYSAFLFNIVLLLKRNTPLILEINTNNEKEAELLNNKIRILLNTFFETPLSKKAKKIVSYGYPLSGNVMKECTDKIKIILNGLNESSFEDKVKDIDNKDVKEIRNKYSLVALFYGYFYPWHGLDRIIDIVKNHKNIGLMIAGTGAEKQLNIVREGSKEENIIYLGYCDKNTIKSLINYTDFAFASMAFDRINWEYGSPLKIAEYLRYGLPIVMNFKVKGLTEKVDYLHKYKNKEDFEDFCKKVKSINKEKIMKDFHYFFDWNRIVKEDILEVDEK